jgi:hypothetical protein
VSSENDDIEELRLKLMLNMFERAHFDLFLKTPYGKYLLEGIDD